MSDRKLLEAISAMIDIKLESIRAEMIQMRQDIDEHFGPVDERFYIIDVKVNKRFDLLDEKLDILESHINDTAKDSLEKVRQLGREFHSL